MGNKGLKLLFLFLFLFLIKSFSQNSNCLKAVQFAFGGSGSDIAYDIIDAGNNQFYVVGTTDGYGAGGTDIMILKTDEDGNIIWSKVFGGVRDEYVRRAKKTTDGGVLVTGQTKSFSNVNGDILCLKVNADGSLAWSRKFGVGSPYGDLGMDIIETSDGGYAISGILNVQGIVADLSLLRLDNNANIIWSKKYDSNEGENGVGILQKEDTLIVSGDVDNSSSVFNGIIMKFNLNDGSYYNGKKIIPKTRDLFNSYVFKDPGSGYWISAHMIDGDSYAQMQQTILKLDDNFNITHTYKIDVNGTYTNDFITGFIPLSNGFVTCASPQTNASGYINQVNTDGTIKFSKKISGTADRSFYRVGYINNKLIAVGKDNTNGNNDFLIAELGDDGSLDAACSADTALINISKPSFTVNDFAWTTISSPTFNNTNINLSNSAISVTRSDLCYVNTCTNTMTADFIIPDSVCANTPVTIKNNTTGGTNFYWNFNVADINSNPEGTNLGNIGGLFSLPVFTDQVYVNGNYYVFVVNNYPGGLVRLDFGNSMLNTPTPVNLGDVGGIIPNNAEGIQIEQSDGRWYALIVGGYPAGGVPSRIIKIDFGTNITNTSPVGTNWGNIGNLAYPIDLHVFQENNNWYGFTVNSENNTITRFNFGQNFNNPPTAVNLGNLGNLSGPTGIYAINDNGNWSVFITNGTDNSSITRLDFGTSLLNTPTAVNLGNVGNTLYRPRDIYLMKFCGELIGFVVNGLETKNDIVRLDFNNNLLSTPTAQSLGNIGDLYFPHSLSQIFRVGADLYTMITNVRNNTLTRLRFAGTTSSNIPNSTDSTPPTITYSSPGIYNINLMVDEGLATQTSICKSITVVASPVKTPIFDTAFCSGDSLFLKTSFPVGSYTWNTGSTDSNIIVKQPGTYWVQSDYYGCTVRDSINTFNSVTPFVNLGKDTSTCNVDSLLLNAGNPGATYLWQDGSTSQTYLARDSGLYYVQVTNAGGCKAKDSIRINEFTPINLQVTNDTTLCLGSQLTLSANGSNIQTYSWSPSATLSNTSIKNPVASPTDTTLYYVNVTDINGCKQTDSVKVNIAALPTVSTLTDTSLCKGTNIILSTSATAGVSYSWSPSDGLSSIGTASPTASPLLTTQYVVTVKTQANCKSSDTVKVVVNPLPAVAAGTLEPLICIGDSTSISATSPTAISYTWSPAAGLNNTSIASPTATPNATTNYRIQVADINGCTSQDSVLVSIKQKPVFAVNPQSAGICTGESVTLTASGGDEYAWYPPNTLSNPNASTTIATPTASTQYKVVITDNICAVTDSLFTTVNITALSSIDVSKSNDVDCILGTTTLRATGGVIYNWYPATYLSDSTIASPIAAPLETTTYHVQVTNANGCTGTDSITVYVYKGSVENGYKLPSAFTPNNDGNNDCFGVRKWGTLSNLDFSVYDRWGVLLFHTKNPSDCWDGTYNGKSQPPGTYVYQIRAQALCGTVYRKGTVVLIR